MIEVGSKKPKTSKRTHPIFLNTNQLAWIQRKTMWNQMKMWIWVFSDNGSMWDQPLSRRRVSVATVLMLYGNHHINSWRYWAASKEETSYIPINYYTLWDQWLVNKRVLLLTRKSNGLFEAQLRILSSKKCAPPEYWFTDASRAFPSKFIHLGLNRRYQTKRSPKYIQY